MALIMTLCTTIGIFLLKLMSISCSKEEYRLVTDLLVNYDVAVRPVEKPQLPVVVSMDLALAQILDLNEKNQVLTGNYWISFFWEDTSLKWDPAAYGDINYLRISVERLWRPDITLINDVTMNRRVIEKLYPAIIDHEGNVAWHAPVILHSSCPLDITYFPWDQQNCQLNFSSWTYDALSLDFYNYTPSGEMKYFVGDGEWLFTGFSVLRHVEYYPEPYPELMYTVQLKRKPLYYLYNIALPCVFVTFCGMLVFLLPPESGEKVSMSVTMLLSSTVFLLIVAESMPPQSDVVPLLGQYFLAAILLLVLSTVITVAVLNVHHRGGLNIDVPPTLRKLLLEYLALIVGMKSTVRSMQGDQNVVKVVPLDMTRTSIGTNLTTTPNPSKEQHRNEWIIIAMVLDRLFLIIFLIVTVLVTVILMCQHP